MRARESAKLAIEGGEPVVSEPGPQNAKIGEKEKAAVVDLFDRLIKAGGAVTYNGPEEKAYCEAFAEWLGGGYADAVNSGTNAVFISIKALDLPPFSEVIVPPISDPGGVMPVALNNLIPVPADAAPGSYNAGPDQIAERVTPRTSAILVAHISGEPLDMAPVMKIAREKKLAVIEDCAQAHGAVYRGKLCGTFGAISAFSTMFGKHHCTGGQGGVVFAKTQKLNTRARQCADRGKPSGAKAPGNVVASLNMNMDELGACIGRVQFKRLPTIVRARRKAAEKIREGVAGMEAVSAPELPARAEPSYWFLRLRLDASKLTVGKERFCEALGAEIKSGVNASYNAMPSEQPWFKERCVFGRPGLPWTSPDYQGDPGKEYPLPNAHKAIEDHFRLNIHEGMRVSDASKIVKALKKVEAAYLKG